MIPELLHQAQRGIHCLRGYVHPRMIASYFELRDRPLPEDSSRRNLAVYDFHHIDIDNVMGRYLFHLVRDFFSLGYYPAYTDRFKFLASVHRKRYKRLLLDIPFHTVPKNQLPDRDFIYITDHPTKAPTNAEAIIRISYDKRRKSDTSEFEFPFFVHPAVTVSNYFPPRPDTSSARDIRLFFAGNTRSKQYSKGNVRGKFNMMPRNEVLEITKAHFGAVDCKDVACEQDLRTPSDHFFQCVESSRHRIPSNEWLPILSRADFFLCCPGVAMPLCHNLIESLACGTIPIIEYGHFLDPHLVHGENCLTFHDRASLKRALDLASVMPPAAVRIMRENALDYYHRHLAEGRFAEKLLTAGQPESTVLLNAYRIPRPSPSSAEALHATRQPTHAASKPSQLVPSTSLL
ncbi:glycosyltransferase family 1 protein [Verrucomicrobiaceae bacterium 5K15]|uniref:Glycosyltransferase family 1 protein n=1 Tax=Oceaniferula flava TaxID=2800421 RepID=A0AAE2S9R9_9BACT|nr:glycosyltransferase [Oceaniferula flavus]MBK1853951.1 glycosyltransferase family 1 protein [Oceaniferula flavus]MBM1135257.1 glycosyltransferase family 1 protein [Oceaniferula flavus]